MLVTVLLKGLNEIDYDNVKPFYQVIAQILTIRDSLQLVRMEWLFGFAVPKALIRPEFRFPYFGSAMINYIDDEVTIFPSPLFYG